MSMSLWAIVVALIVPIVFSQGIIPDPSTALTITIPRAGTAQMTIITTVNTTSVIPLGGANVTWSIIEGVGRLVPEDGVVVQSDTTTGVFLGKYVATFAEDGATVRAMTDSGAFLDYVITVDGLSADILFWSAVGGVMLLGFCIILCVYCRTHVPRSERGNIQVEAPTKGILFG